MQTVEIIKRHEPSKTFRVASVIGTYDLPEIVEEKFMANFDLPDKWNVGIIVGRSGTGKSTISKKIFGNCVDFGYGNNSILDDFPENLKLDEICECLSCVGFSSPPSWLKPYHVLSNGEKMRVELARAILDNRDIILFDEYTSVIDRQVAQIGSLATQKIIRKLNKKFVAVTCHYDVIEWLNPDWTFCTDTMCFQNNNNKEKKKYNCNCMKYWKNQKNKEFGRFLENIII